jgi:hypothetical protein
VDPLEARVAELEFVVHQLEEAQIALREYAGELEDKQTSMWATIDELKAIAEELGDD